MPLVPQAGQAELSAATRRATRRGLAIAAGAGLLLAGCGSSQKDDAAGGAGASIGVPARQVTCDDWRKASRAQREGTVRTIRHFAGGPVGSPAGHGAVLTDQRAYAILDRYCRQSFAGHFKLYKLYTRAASFTRQPAPPKFP